MRRGRHPRIAGSAAAQIDRFHAAFRRLNAGTPDSGARLQTDVLAAPDALPDLGDRLPHIEIAGLAEAVGVDELPGADSRPVQRRQETESRQFLDRMRQHVDADAQLAQFARPLIDFGFDADLVQGQCRGEAADSGADDDNLHHRSVELRGSRALRPQSLRATGGQVPKAARLFFRQRPCKIWKRDEPAQSRRLRSSLRIAAVPPSFDHSNQPSSAGCRLCWSS